MEKNILVAEDEADIVEILKLYLTAEGYNVFSAANGQLALDVFQKEQIHLLIADLMMPVMNGYELIRHIRQDHNLPIIILSAKSMDMDKVLGLNIGADVYITKPFNPLEVVAYVNASFRRYYKLGADAALDTTGSGAPGGSIPAETVSVLQVGELQLDTANLELTKRGEKVSLTPAELKILMHLMRSPGRVFTKNQLYECINGEYYENTDNTMMVHIANLRSKIEDDPSSPKYIKTIRGLGYKIDPVI